MLLPIRAISYDLKQVAEDTMPGQVCPTASAVRCHKHASTTFAHYSDDAGIADDK